jgi:hypothetical protein
MALELKTTKLDSPERPATNPGAAATGEASQINKRRSVRVSISIPVTIFGQDSDGKIFAEKTTTVTVSAHGAMVVLDTEIDNLKPALLVNTRTGTEVHCRIAHRKEIAKNRIEIGLEFDNPYPRFWAMNFPPDDWDPAERKKATSQHEPYSGPKKDSKK